MMDFILVGVNHRSAPVEVREKLAIADSYLAEATRRLINHPGIAGGLILSTCNRVELLALSQNGSADLRKFFCDYFALESPDFSRWLYEYHERDAIRHVFRVASSLDSMILGEPQILGQVKGAYATARSVGAVHAQLESLITRSFAVAKRVRTETAIGSSTVSVASAAVDLAKKIFGSLQGKRVLLVGAGKMSELAARHLLTQGVSTILVANRTRGRAQELAQKFASEVISFEELYEVANTADIVITSTGSPHFIFSRTHGEMFMSRRKNRPMFFIDIAVPRDVDPEMNQLEGIFIYDIDDLNSIVNANLGDRHQRAELAEAIVEEEVSRFIARRQTVEAVPTILSLQQRLESIRLGEMSRLRKRLGSLSPEQEDAVDAMTRGIVNKILHTPIHTLKNASGQPESSSIIEMVRRIFDLREDDDDHS